MAVGQNREDTSYDVFLHKDVPFVSCVDTVSHLGSQIVQKIWGREQAFSSQTRKIFKLSYHENYCMDSNQILDNDKVFQVLYVGGPKMRHTNPRWRTAIITPPEDKFS